MGLCEHGRTKTTKKAVIMDVYNGDKSETLRIPYRNLLDLHTGSIFASLRGVKLP